VGYCVLFAITLRKLRVAQTPLRYIDAYLKVRGRLVVSRRESSTKGEIVYARARARNPRTTNNFNSIDEL